MKTLHYMSGDASISSFRECFLPVLLEPLSSQKVQELS